MSVAVVGDIMMVFHIKLPTSLRFQLYSYKLYVDISSLNDEQIVFFAMLFDLLVLSLFTAF